MLHPPDSFNAKKRGRTHDPPVVAVPFENRKNSHREALRPTMNVLILPKS
jgi:hypothetical protein